MPTSWMDWVAFSLLALYGIVGVAGVGVLIVVSLRVLTHSGTSENDNDRRTSQKEK